MLPGTLLTRMGPIIALIVIALVSLLLVRVATQALVLTGLSLDTAHFQAVSAFFGVGFTTREAELVMNHPVRRRIIRDLIIVGNIGLTSALATIIVSFVAFDDTAQRLLLKVALLAGALVAVTLLWRIPVFRRALDWVIGRTLARAGVVRALDYEVLLRAQDGFTIAECVLEPDHPLAGQTLAGIKLRNHGVVVLGIARADGTYLGVPHGDAQLLAGDVLTVYGRESDLRRGLRLPPPASPEVQTGS